MSTQPVVLLSSHPSLCSPPGSTDGGHGTVGSWVIAGGDAMSMLRGCPWGEGLLAGRLIGPGTVLAM